MGISNSLTEAKLCFVLLALLKKVLNVFNGVFLSILSLETESFSDSHSPMLSHINNQSEVGALKDIYNPDPVWGPLG